MSADSKNVKAEEGRQILQLARHGTFLAKSSDFTRAAAILHTSDVEVGTDGSFDQGRVIGEKTAGVGFVSAASRLDRIFQKDLESKKDSPVPPPPPPPNLPPTSVTVKPTSTDGDVKKIPLPPGAASQDANVANTASSDGSNPADSASHIETPTSLPATVQSVAAPPPLEGMFVRMPTRHRKLIKTRLSDLPREIQEQEPQIRGGVAIYRVTDPTQREQFGNMVEINAVDYIVKLKSTIEDLERKVSLLQGRLEQHTPQPSKQNLRSSLRMSTFIGKRSKDSDSRSQDSSEGLTGRRHGRRPPTPKSPQLRMPYTSEKSKAGKAADIVPSADKEDDKKKEAQVVSFPNGFGFGVPPTTGSRTFMSPSREGTTKNNHNATFITPSNMTVNMPAGFGSSSATPPGGDTQGPDLTKNGRNISDASSAPLTRAAKSQSSVDDETTSPAQRQLSEPPTSGKGFKPTHDPVEDASQFKPQKPDLNDRNAAPMPGLGATTRTRRTGAVGRTHSFAGHGTDRLRAKGEGTDEAESASRTFSMHRESNATPPVKKAETKPSRRRGVRRLLGLR